MKKVAIIIGLLLLFLILCQTLVMSAGLINEPSTLLFNTGLVLFGLQIFAIVVLVNQTYNLIVKWSQKTETTFEVDVELILEESPEKPPEETPVVKRKKRSYYKPKKKSDFPIGEIEKKEKQTNLKPKKDE